jgi:hypothetical protein
MSGHAARSADPSGRRVDPVVLSCSCGDAVDVERLSGSIWVKSCPNCGTWDTLARVPLRRRCIEMLISTVARYAHPDDVVFLPWTP